MTFLTADQATYLVETYPERTFIAKVFMVEDKHSAIQSFDKDQMVSVEALGSVFNMTLLSDKELTEEIAKERVKPKYGPSDYERSQYWVDRFIGALGQNELLELSID